MQRFEDADLVTTLHQVAGAAQSRGTGTDHRDALAGKRRALRQSDSAGALLVIGDEALEVADADGFFLPSDDASALALVFLRTHAASDRGQHVVFADLRRRAEI